MDLLDSFSLKLSWAAIAGERSRTAGDLGCTSRIEFCIRCRRSGLTGGEERRDVFPDVRPDDRSDSRGGAEGERRGERRGEGRRQFIESGPLGRLSRRSGLRERGRKALATGGGDLRTIGDRARRLGRFRSNGDLDRLLLRYQ